MIKSNSKKENLCKENKDQRLVYKSFLLEVDGFKDLLSAGLQQTTEAMSSSVSEQVSEIDQVF